MCIRDSMYSALIGGLLPCTSSSVVGLRWWAGLSRAGVPSMVSCYGFGFPIHALPSRLFVHAASTACLIAPGLACGQASPTKRLQTGLYCTCHIAATISGRRLAGPSANHLPRVDGALRRLSIALCKGNDFLFRANLHAFCRAAGKHPTRGAAVLHTIEL